MSHGLLRLEVQVRRALSEIIHEMKDPRLPAVISVERVRLLPDLSQARVLISALERSPETVLLLNYAHHYVQGELAHRMPLRRVPKLRFFDQEGEVL